jgi:apyrase
LLFGVGAEEGIYAWVAANYAQGTLGGDSRETTGIIELGGASVQVPGITFTLKKINL